ncbi:MAG: chemotaxis protein CheW [Rhodospirillaceae bacterium]|nr:chemotaxis protein CheW [Rhodospirillaceae bacterium]
MSQALIAPARRGHLVHGEEPPEHAAEFVTMTVADQGFGILVGQVHDVLSHHRLTRIPLAPPEVAGSLNLRGRIVTAIDVRRRLDLEPRPAGMGQMSIVVDHGGEPYSLLVDSVGDVVRLPLAGLEPNPATLNRQWRDVSAGIYRLDQTLLVVLDVANLLNIPTRVAA